MTNHNIGDIVAGELLAQKFTEGGLAACAMTLREMTVQLANYTLFVNKVFVQARLP